MTKFKKNAPHYADVFYSAENTKYPVYIIAAEGGGIYAAHHAAVWLSRMQDICPSFAQHIFAISGISGGSVGGSVFAGLIDSDLTDHIESAQNDRYQRPVRDHSYTVHRVAGGAVPPTFCCFQVSYCWFSHLSGTRILCQASWRDRVRALFIL